MSRWCGRCKRLRVGNAARHFVIRGVFNPKIPKEKRPVNVKRVINNCECSRFFKLCELACTRVWLVNKTRRQVLRNYSL